MIAWLPWGADAFGRARDEGKPVLLSLTAAWCHACHRMDEETWDNPGVAREVARLAVPVRVDADARPDLYQRYHLGGLPTTLLLTADAEPITGGTFLEVPQLLAVLGAVRDPLTPIPSPLRGEGEGEGATAARIDLVGGFLALLARRADPVHGGFGVAPKRPEPEAIALLLRQARATGDAMQADIARRALDAIAEHLADPVEGGFFRYAEGADWSGAHTEKLAVDQAALVTLFLEAAPALDEPRYLETARRTLDFVAARLLTPEGGVQASLAAAPDYYRHRGDRDPDAAPALDARRFLDAEAAMVSATVAAGAFGRVRASFLALAPGALPHRLDAPADGPVGLLGDLALAIHAAVDVHRAGLDWARRTAEWAAAQLWDEARGAFRDAPAAAAPGLPSLPPLLPLLGNGRMALALAHLADHLPDEAARAALLARARRVTDALAPAALRSPAGAALALARQRLDAPRGWPGR